MQHIEQVNINGSTHFVFNQANLLCLIRDYMGDQVATLVVEELKEANEDKEEALFTADAAYKDLEGRTSSLQTALEDLRTMQHQMSVLLDAKRLNRGEISRLLRDMQATINFVL